MASMVHPDRRLPQRSAPLCPTNFSLSLAGKSGKLQFVGRAVIRRSA